jgi:tyrosine-protein phosphatase SIW14
MGVRVRGRFPKVTRRTLALALLLPPIVLGGCRSKAGPRRAGWAQPVLSATLTNLYLVDAGVYRSEQPTRKGFEEIRAKGIKTVINLRDNHSDAALIGGLGFELVAVPMKAWHFSEDDIVKALKAIQAAPKPVLVHCQWGADRAGVVMAMYRIVFQGWTKDEALAEMREGGFGFHLYYLNIPIFIKRADIARIKDRLKTP